jgi:hypothetical protein
MPAAKPTPGNLHEEIDLGNLLGSTWKGFILLPGESRNQHQGKILHPYWRKPFEAGELCAMFWNAQRVYHYEHETARLKKDAEEASLRADQAEEREQFYRRELMAASRLGLMFSSILD